MTSETSTSDKKKTPAAEDCPHEILIAEFNYARETAAQAMEDRHKRVNFFLIIVGILANAIGVLLTYDSTKSQLLSEEYRIISVSILLLMIFFIGILYLLKLIRLRSAWFESALCMNQIKDYYNANFPNSNLKRKAFRWTKETLVRQQINKLSTLFGLSALLVIFINSFAFFGFLLLTLKTNNNIIIAAAVLAATLLLQIGCYKSALSEKRLPK